jgi:hypothetical protein
LQKIVRILLAKWEKLFKHLEKAIGIFDAVETAPGSFLSLFVFIDANEKLTTFSVGESRQGTCQLRRGDFDSFYVREVTFLQREKLRRFWRRQGENTDSSHILLSNSTCKLKTLAYLISMPYKNLSLSHCMLAHLM